MSLEEPTPAPPAGPDRTRTVTFDLGKLPSAGTAIGVGLLSAAVLVAVLHTRNSFDIMTEGSSFDLSVFLVGVAAVLALLGIAVAGRVLERITEPTAVSWPGAAGAAGAGALLAVLIDNDPAALYAAAALILAISLVGIAVTKAGPFAVTAFVAVTLLYIQAFDDTTDGVDLDGTSGIITAGAAITAYVILVSVAGWFFRETRVLTATLAGISGLVAMVFLLQALVFLGMFSAAFSSSVGTEDSYSEPAEPFGSAEDIPCEEYFDEEGTLDEQALEECYGGNFGDGGLTEEDFPEDEFDEEFDDEALLEFEDGPLSSGATTEVWTILGFGLLLAGFWTAFGMATGHIAFRILVLADVAILIPAATMALVVEHPTWWEVALLVLGGLVLLVSAGAVRRRRAAVTPPFVA